MNFFNDVEKIVYRKKTEDPVILLEYIKFSDEKQKEKYILFKFKNNLAQTLKALDVEVTQYDSNDHKLGKIVFNYTQFVAKGYEIFVPTAKLQVQYDTAYIEVKILGACFETFVYAENKFNAIPFKETDFKGFSTKKEKQISKKSSEETEVKVKGARKTKYKDVSRSNYRRPKFIVTLFVLALIAVSLYATITIKNSTKNLSDENFEYEIIDSKNLEITTYKGEGVEVVIPEKFKRYNITSIREKAFIDSQVERVYFQGEKMVIGKEAFKNCFNLSEVVDETGCVSAIATEAFSNCYNLSKAIFRNATISNNAFVGCNSITYIAYGDIESMSLTSVFGTRIPTTLKTVEIKSGEISTAYFGTTTTRITTLILNGDVVVNVGGLLNLRLTVIRIGKDAVVVPKALKGQSTTLQLQLHEENSFDKSQYAGYARFITTYSD